MHPILLAQFLRWEISFRAPKTGYFWDHKYCLFIRQSEFSLTDRPMSAMLHKLYYITFKDAKIKKQILVMTISGNYFQKYTYAVLENDLFFYLTYDNKL